MQCHFPPSYVLDDIEWYEINAALKYQYYSVKDGWEQARLISYLIAQTNSRRTLKMTDIIEFPWEKESDKVDQSITKEDIERLTREAEQYIKQNTEK